MKDDIVEGMLVRSDTYEGTGIVVRIEEQPNQLQSTVLRGVWHRVAHVHVLWSHLTSATRHLCTELEIVEP